MNRLKRVNRLASGAFGPQGWWPARSAFEMMLGAILTQNTAWTQVEKAIANLRKAKALTPRSLLRLGPSRLSIHIRPSGYFRQKSGRILFFSRWYLRRFGGSLARMRRADPGRLRGELLALPGIGPEAAASIPLYALGHPVFVVDAYTRRIGVRHGLLRRDASYEEIRALFERELPKDAPLFNDYHAQLVRIGKDFCRKREPSCRRCPLRSDLRGEQPRPL